MIFQTTRQLNQERQNLIYMQQVEDARHHNLRQTLNQNQAATNQLLDRLITEMGVLNTINDGRNNVGTGVGDTTIINISDTASANAVRDLHHGLIAGDTIGYNIDGVIFPSIAEIQAEQNTYRDSLIAQFFPSEAQQNQLQLDSLAIINMATSIRNIDIGLGFGGSSPQLEMNFGSFSLNGTQFTLGNHIIDFSKYEDLYNLFGQVLIFVTILICVQIMVGRQPRIGV